MTVSNRIIPANKCTPNYLNTPLPKNTSMAAKNSQVSGSENQNHINLIDSRHEILGHIQLLILREKSIQLSGKRVDFFKIPIGYYVGRKAIIQFYCEYLKQYQCDFSIAVKAISILDRYLSSNLEVFKLKNLHYFSISALSLAAKNYGYKANNNVWSLLERILLHMQKFNLSGLEQCELKMLNQLDWHVDVPDAHDYAQNFLHLAVSFVDYFNGLSDVIKKMQVDMQRKIILFLKNPECCQQYNRFDIGLGIALNALNADLHDRHGLLTPAEHYGFKFSLEILLEHPINHSMIDEVQDVLMNMIAEESKV